jgi:acetolactate synthase-1/2/3 large subunit
MPSRSADTVGITRSCTKHNYLVTDVDDLARILHEAFYVATSGRPGPVVIDIPKDVQFATGTYTGKANGVHKTYLCPSIEGDAAAIEGRRRADDHGQAGPFSTPAAASSIPARKPPGTAQAAVRETGIPVTSTLMGLGAFPASHKDWLGMVGMHGSYEANNGDA